MILIGEASLQRAAASFLVHYHRERNHQGSENRIIEPETIPFPRQGAIRCRQRLAGMLRYYYQCCAQHLWYGNELQLVGLVLDDAVVTPIVRGAVGSKPHYQQATSNNCFSELGRW